MGLILVLLTSMGLSKPPTTPEIDALRQELQGARSDSAPKFINEEGEMMEPGKAITAQRSVDG
jgi:hypothetical protein